MKSIAILSQRIDSVTPPQILSFIKESIKDKRKALIFAMNVHILVELARDKSFQKIHNSANLIFCDGVPLVWISKLLKHSLPTRVSGTDLVDSILKNKKNKVFLLGTTDEVLRKMKDRYPEAVVGYFSPPFGDKWNSIVNKIIVNMIVQSKAQILLVGVGPLKQEKWLLQYFDKTEAYVGIGVGSAFDILSGRTPRAPALMQRFALEWVWRIILEPRRLLKRYLSDMYEILRIIIAEFVPKKQPLAFSLEDNSNLDRIGSFYKKADPLIFPTSISFSQGQKLTKLIEKYRPTNILQIGCAYGISSLWIESAADYLHNHTIVEILPENIKKTKKNLKEFGLGSNIHFIEGFSQVELGKLLKRGLQYDFIFHDGDERFDGLMADVFFIQKLLKLKGLYVQRNLWNPSIREVIAFVLSNYKYKILEINQAESLLLKNIEMRKKILQKLGHSKLNDLIVLQKKSSDERNWDHFKAF